MTGPEDEPVVDRPAPARRDRPPLAWLVAPVVVGLLAAGGVAWERVARERARPALCDRLEPLFTALGDPRDPDVGSRLAAAAGDLELEELVEVLPDDLAARFRGKDELWSRLVANAQDYEPGDLTISLVPFRLLGDVSALAERYERDCAER